MDPQIIARLVTPTPMASPMPATPAFTLGGETLNGVNITYAQDLIQGYNYINQNYSVFDTLFTVALVLIVIGGIFMLVRSLRDFNDD